MKIPDEYLDWRTKGVWNPGPPVTLTEFAAARHNLFGGAFTWPVMVARRTAIEHNVRTMADYCERHGALFAPHGKTSMAPSLFQAQLDAGAWAITVATPNQALVCVQLGVPRIVLANEVVDPVALRWLAAQPDTEILIYADSVAAVQRLAESGGRFQVLLEWGYPGGRAGCRTVADALAVAQAVHDAPNLDLVGISSFEGLMSDDDAVQSFLDSMVEATKAIAHLLPADPIVTAGGSAYFDLVTATFGGQWLEGRQIRLVLRSGAYISHDHGTYGHKTPFLRAPAEGALDAALEVWAQVLATPEPGLAILGMGKREAPYDDGLPVPLRVRRAGSNARAGREDGESAGSGTADGRVEAADGLEVLRLNDHHGHLSVRDEGAVAVGDLVCLGISHPCTAFDKWSVIPVVEDDYTVTELLRTYF